MTKCLELEYFGFKHPIQNFPKSRTMFAYKQPLVHLQMLLTEPKVAII